MRVVHLLWHGLALCGAGEPNSWPSAHRWLAASDYSKEAGKDSFCLDCVAEWEKTEWTIKS